MLLSYALSQQAKFGDLPWSTPKPPAWNIKASYMYGAWEKQKGRARTDARKDFIQLTEAILAVQGDDQTLKAQGQKYLDNVKDVMNKNVNPGFVDNTIKFRDEDHVNDYLRNKNK